MPNDTTDKIALVVLALVIIMMVTTIAHSIVAQARYAEQPELFRTTVEQTQTQ